MPTIEHPLGLNSEQHRAFSERVFSQTVGIVNLVRAPHRAPNGKTASVEEMGTGSACRWRDRNLVLTAKHVVEGAGPSQLRFFLRPSGKIEWVARSGPVEFAERELLEVDDVITCGWEDLAALVSARTHADSPSLHFCALPDKFGTVPPAPGVTLIIGYPGDLSFPVASSRQPTGSINYACAATPAACWASVVDETPRFFPSSYDSDRHFLLHFDPAEEGSMPHGYSGTGVWYQSATKREIWTADPVLCGVQVRWHRESNLMIAVQSEIVRQFLEENVG